MFVKNYIYSAYTTEYCLKNGFKIKKQQPQNLENELKTMFLSDIDRLKQPINEL